MKEMNKEDYLRAIYSICEDKKDKISGIKSIDISKRLGVSKASVSEMIRKLAKEGYLIMKPYSTIQITEKGLKEAKRITHNHRLIEFFLRNILNYNINKVHMEAHKLEHAFSPSTIKKLDRFLGNPKVSPHGKWIHNVKDKNLVKQLKIHKNIIPITSLEQNEKGKIVYLFGNQKIVQRLSDLGLTPESEVTLIRKALRRGTIELVVRRTTLAIAIDIAKNIFIEPSY